MADIKNIIIIGKVGSGKSALANALSNSDEFKEETVDKEFESEKIKYRVIDAVGLGDIKLTKEKLLEKFEEEIGTYIDEDVSQIFLTIEGKFSESEKSLNEFLWLNEYLFDNKVLDYTTIIRTNFPNFRNKENCEKDIKELINFFNDNGKENYAELNEKVLKKEKIVHVDNPPFNENLRKKSNKKLLDYLKKCSDGEPYRSNLSKWLTEKYPENERENKTVLDISGQKLKGRLNLKGFANLRRLNCAGNQLTSMDLSGCKKLVELNCADNKFASLNFLKSVSSDNLLEQLNISNCCSLKGDLQSLKNLTKLETLFITNTNLDGDLE
ncbi:9416_t:CDS:2 [Racocetra fulgida]|uniref:9416_t:CDS:1 n=1 Tax=Racocetra fulgida TaxID=60492 RepID=A0A9N8VDE3_9GLOM|nr:9416_t:CDS:2 [Racocetra fulgida]